MRTCAYCRQPIVKSPCPCVVVSGPIVFDDPTNDADEIYKAFAQVRASGAEEPRYLIVPATPDGKLDVDKVVDSMAARAGITDREWLDEVKESMRTLSAETADGCVMRGPKE